jgi:hypothetical protein
MPRQLSPSGERWMREILGDERAEQLITRVNAGEGIPSRAEFPYRLGDVGYKLLSETLGKPAADQHRIAIAADADKFAAAKETRDGQLVFRTPLAKLTPTEARTKLERDRAVARERMRRRRAALRKMAADAPPKDADEGRP